MTIIALITFIVMIFFDRSPLKILSLGSVPLLFGMSIAYDLRDLALIQFWFEKGAVSDWFLYQILFFSLSISLFLSIVVTRPLYAAHVPAVISTGHNSFSYSILVTIGLLLFLISFASFLVMLLPSASSASEVIYQLSENPRAWEYQFGRSRLLNYFYFLKIPAISCLAFAWSKKSCSFSLFLAVVIMGLSMSFFHGIKFTILDTISIPALVIFSIQPSRYSKLLFIIPLVALSIFFFYFSFVRGSTQGALLGIVAYWLSGFHNLAYLLETHPSQFGGFFEMLISERLLDPFSDLTNRPFLGFALNDLYNMNTGLTVLYRNLWILAPIVFFPILFLALAVSLQRARKSFAAACIFAFLFYSYVLMFFYYPFTKEKMVYILLISIAAHVLSIKKPTRSSSLSPSY